MTMCPTCGCFDGHYQGCPRLEDPDDFLFSESLPKPKKCAKKRKMFGTKEPEEEKKK